jgi:hypothetical protein
MFLLLRPEDFLSYVAAEAKMAAERKASAKEKDPLANAAINLAALREYARKELMGIVESIKVCAARRIARASELTRRACAGQGPKALILDETLSGPLVPSKSARSGGVSWRCSNSPARSLRAQSRT